MFHGKVLIQYLEIHFLAEIEDPQWYESKDPSHIEWKITEIYNLETEFPFCASALKRFTDEHNEELDKAITAYCLEEKEKSDEASALRNV